MASAMLFLLAALFRSAAVAEQGVTLERSIKFSGLVWKVKASAGRVGPGNNFFSDSNDNVRVDGQGKLHLKITEHDGQWHCGSAIGGELWVRNVPVLR